MDISKNIPILYCERMNAQTEETPGQTHRSWIKEKFVGYNMKLSNNAVPFAKKLIAEND